MLDRDLDPVVSSDVVSAYVRGLIGESRRFVSRLHPDDEMFLYNLHLQRGSMEAAAILYYSKGRQIDHAVREVARWRFGAPSAVPSLLDFASGFGRAIRFLVLEIPPKRIWASEIDASAVLFQSDAFGVRGLTSPEAPRDFQPGRAFGMIVASSFFSHLPPGRFEEWLSRLFGLLEPGGVLLFSVHGEALLAAQDADWSSGIVFRPESETRRLDGSVYGTSWVKDAFVRKAVSRVCGTTVGVRHFPFGFCAEQDAYVLVRGPEPDLAALEIARYPRGELTRFDFDEIAVRLEGWAAGATDERPPDVQLVCRQEVLERTVTSGDPGSVRPWKFRVERPRISPDDVLRVEAISERGLENILAMGTLRPHLEGTVR